MEGHILFDNEQYSRAFSSYAQACIKALSFNDLMLREKLEIVVVHLQTLDSDCRADLAIQYCDFLVDLWRRENLEDRGPFFHPSVGRDEERSYRV